MPEGILDFFELVWAESQSLDSRESKKDILYTGTKSLPCTSAAADGLQQRGVGSAVLHVSPEYYLRITAHGKLQVSQKYHEWQEELITSIIEDVRESFLKSQNADLHLLGIQQDVYSH